MVEVDDLQTVRKKKPGEGIKTGDIIDLTPFVNDTVVDVFGLISEEEYKEMSCPRKEENLFKNPEYIYPGGVSGVLPESSLLKDKKHKKNKRR